MICLIHEFGESLKIGEDVTIRVLGLDVQGEVRIGIEAPWEIVVELAEIYCKRKARKPVTSVVRNKNRGSGQ